MTESMELKSGYVTGIKKFMRGDGPGIRTVVFLKGCSLRCMWCSSPQTWSKTPHVVFLHQKCIGCGRCQAVCGQNAIQFANGHRVNYEKCTFCGKCVECCPSKALRADGILMTSDEVMDEVIKDFAYFKSTGGGVTLSGGEASLQADFAAEILNLCTQIGIHTAIETCGFSDWPKLKQLLNLSKIVYYDIKHMDPGKHSELTGQGNELIFNNLKNAARECSCEIVINLPLIPGCNDGGENLACLADFMKALSLYKIRALPFHRLGKHEYEELGIAYGADDLKPQSPDQIKEIKQFLIDKGLTVVDS